jgi:hypothetical protein
MRVLLIVLLVFSFFSLSFMTLKDLKDADELYERITVLNYKKFVRAPGFEKRTQSEAEMQHFFKEPLTVDIYMNEIVEEALTKDSIEEWPVGSLLVKDGFLDDKLELISVLEKREDGWFYAEWNGEATAKTAGYAVQVCIGCHASGDDMVRAFRFPQYRDSK